jgi:hypothetical protein
MTYLNSIVLVILLGFTVACNAEEKKVETKQVATSEVKTDVKEEDCEDRAKKKVEITPESITLGSGTTGCSLDEAK